MATQLARVAYDSLNARQKENYNCMKLAGVLAEFGFVSMRLSDDSKGADLLAVHVDGQTILRIQLKSRCCFRKDYCDKGLLIAFRLEDQWYLLPHDEVLNKVLAKGKLVGTRSWDDGGGYSFPNISRVLQEIITPYKIPTQK